MVRIFCVRYRNTLTRTYCHSSYLHMKVETKHIPPASATLQGNAVSVPFRNLCGPLHPRALAATPQPRFSLAAWDSSCVPGIIRSISLYVTGLQKKKKSRRLPVSATLHTKMQRRSCQIAYKGDSTRARHDSTAATLAGGMI